MKRESNNEMDLILRKLGREQAIVRKADGNGLSDGGSEQHLDADELNAYAENALPASTRARYTEHLADCARCRQIVSQLSLAAGVIIDDKPAVALAPSGLKAFLAGLFSPMVVRYAVPAVTLLVVASIGYFALRSSSSLERYSEIASTSSAKKQPESNRPFLDSTPGNVTATKTGTETAKNKTDVQREEPADSKRVAGVAGQKAGESKQEQTTVDQLSAENAPASANSPPAAAESVSVEERAKSPEVAQAKTQPVPYSSVQPASVDDRIAKDREKLSKESERTATFGGSNARGGPANVKNEVGAARVREQDEPINGRDRADKVSETRSVAGRRFRREGSVWVDTGFDSSRSTVNVTRGSEQYRALIADEPEIKTIAEALSGEVIVVWKSTAYRIR